MTITTDQLQALYKTVKELYASVDDLPFHGWHHIEFVYTKTAIFADDLGANKNLAQAAALVHDLNYLAKRNQWSSPEAGQEIREEILHECGFSAALIGLIENIVLTGELNRGGDHLSLEAKALSDADCLFKILPTTPVMFAPRFIAQNNSSIRKLSGRIVGEQSKLVDQDIYFYSALAKKDYMRWARLNLDIWQAVQESLADPSIVKMLEQAGINCTE
ncbi:MAG TPA: HD family phosphohydrolase [Alphaproteobacteria bacterium]